MIKMINKVILIGRLGADPEIGNTSQGSKFANLSLATNKSWKDKEGNYDYIIVRTTALLAATLVIIIVLKSLEQNVIYFLSPSEIYKKENI